jgi:ABC-2 type transport system ATP-binding protein
MVVEKLSLESIGYLRPFAEKTLMQGAQTLIVLKDQHHVRQALDIIRAAKGDLVSLTPHRSSLEDLFIRKATGIEPRLQEAA